MKRTTLPTLALLVVAIGCTNDAPNTRSNDDDHLDDLVLAMTDPDVPVSADTLIATADSLARGALNDDRLALAVTAGDRAIDLRRSDIAERLYVAAARYLDERDPNAKVFPGTIAYLAYRLDRLRTNTNRRGTDEHHLRLEAWLRAAATLDARGMATGVDPAQLTLEAPAIAIAHELERKRYVPNRGLRTWHATWALAEARLVRGDPDAARALFDAAKRAAAPGFTNVNLLDARYAVAAASAGDHEAARVYTNDTAEAALRASIGQTPADALRVLKPVFYSLNDAAPQALDRFVAEAAQRTPVERSEGRALRVAALAVDRPGPAAAWVLTPDFWAAEDAWFDELPARVVLAANVYLGPRTDRDATERRRAFAYVALYEHLVDRLDQSQRLLAEDTVDTDAVRDIAVSAMPAIGFLRSELEPEARLHQAYWPGAIDDLVSDFDVTMLRAGIRR